MCIRDSVNAAADAEKRFYALKAAIKTAEARMSEIQTLRTHITVSYTHLDVYKRQPFGQYQVSDRAFDKLGFSIHNYLFAKALDQVCLLYTSRCV